MFLNGAVGVEIWLSRLPRYRGLRRLEMSAACSGNVENTRLPSAVIVRLWVLLGQRSVDMNLGRAQSRTS